MSSEFDAYYKWLGIPASEQPPNRYRLLGITLFESDRAVIESAADRQMTFLRHHGTGPHSEASQKLLDEVAQAMVVLLDPTKKAAYDEALSRQLGRDKNGGAAAAETAATARRETVGTGAEPRKVAAAKGPASESGSRSSPPNTPRGDKKSESPRWNESAKSDPGKGRVQRRKELASLASLIPAAKQLIARHDYAEAAQMLEQVAVGDRTPELEALRRKATDLEEESDMLLADLRRAVQAREFDGIDENLNRLLELKPGSRFARELRESLDTYGNARNYRFDDHGHLLAAESKGWFDGLKAAIVVGVVAFVAMSYAITIYLKDDRQTVTVEIDEAILKDGIVSLVIEGQALELRGLGDSIKLKPGPHGYEVRRGDSIIVGPASYTVRKGEKNVLTIRLSNIAGSASPPPASASSTKRASGPPPALAVAPFDAAGAKAHQQAWAAYLGMPVEFADPGTGMTFVLIPPGEYFRGSTSEELDQLVKEDPSQKRDDMTEEFPRHRVRLTQPFYLGRHEVTQSEWKAIMGSEPWKGMENTQEGPNYPATYVSWLDTAQFCQKLGRVIGRTCRLPTDAEWEFACRAGTTSRYSFGDDRAKLPEYGWFAKNAFAAGEKYPHLIEKKLPNPFGLFDMHGNVWELCSDGFDSQDFARFADQIVENPERAPDTPHRVSRGGGWGFSDRHARSTDRAKSSPDGKIYYLGFRVALPISVRDSGSPSPSASGPSPPLATAPFTAAQAKANQEAWAKHLGVAAEYTDPVGIQFMLIPPGEFLMGSPDSDTEAADNEKPQHKVRITRPFYLSRTEVTQAQWKQFMGTEPWAGVPSATAETDGPASNVTFDEAVAFCKKLQEGKSGTVYRLPTEAEWEYACRAGADTRYHFGDDRSQLGDFAWYRENSGPTGKKTLHPVGQKKPNAFGLFDMTGNAWEFVSDWYAPYDEGPQDDPVGPKSSTHNMSRGGGYASPRPNSWRCARREPAPIGDRADAVSLRVVKEISRPNTVSAAVAVPSSAVAPFDAVRAKAHQDDWARRLGVPVEHTNSLGMKFRLLPPGEYLRGSPDSDAKAADEEKPQHRVQITESIYLGMHEVTQGDWRSVMETEPWKGQENIQEGAKVAASWVSWTEASEFCQKLSAKEGSTYRLPTDAEWEYACRAGTTTRFSFGDDESIADDYAWTGNNTLGKRFAQEVGLKRANPFGLHDMHGNAWEWCQDVFDTQDYAQFADKTAVNPECKSNIPRRVFRGGGWYFGPIGTRSGRRQGIAPETRSYDVGFRVVLAPREKK